MASTTRMSAHDRRAQLLDVARALFVRDGYRATTADVAAEAGVSQALIVKHFGTKEELFRAAVADPLIELFEQALLEERQLALEDELGSPAEHMERLVRFGGRWAELASEHRAVLVSLLRESVEFPDVIAQLMDLLRRLAEDVAVMLERYAGSAQYVDYDPRMATYATMGALTLGPMFVDDATSFVTDYVDMIFQGLLSDDGRRELRAGA